MLALGITQEAARALATMPALILFPVMQALGLLVGRVRGLRGTSVETRPPTIHV